MEIEGHCIDIDVHLYKIMARTEGKIIEGDYKTITEVTLGEKIIEVKIIEIEEEVEITADTYRDNYRDNYR